MNIRRTGSLTRDETGMNSMSCGHSSNITRFSRSCGHRIICARVMPGKQPRYFPDSLSTAGAAVCGCAAGHNNPAMPRPCDTFELDHNESVTVYQPRVLVSVRAGGSGCLLYGAGRPPQHALVGRELVYLRLGRTGLCIGFVGFHCDQLCRQSDYKPHNGGTHQKNAISCWRSVEFVVARGVQVSTLSCPELQRHSDPSECAAVCSAVDPFARGHLVLYVHGHFLHRRRVPRPSGSAAERLAIRTVPESLSALDRRSYSSLLRHRRATAGPTRRIARSCI